MSDGDEVTLINRWIASTLGGDATLTGLGVTGVHRGVAPVDAALPIVFQLMSAPVVRWVGPARVGVDSLYSVKAIQAGWDARALDPVMARVCALLDLTQNHAVAGGLINACVQQEIVESSLVEEGTVYWQKIALFSIFAQQSA